ncbi:ATP-binding protein [Jannaschia sp. LMIT008]|uniref:ATP-binding protein n=1 Tax=Jannaschia maritima TaxID=3032585 RepID=UPI00281247FE|nr:ATP-binding protein [Jannaschia sp. LMIT008]
MTAERLALACLAYVAFLFTIAFVAERRPGNRLLRGPLVYTLSLSVYCTAWTFYGAVGYAARSGLEFMTIYLGPTLVFVGWWWILRRLVAIGRAERITSIADLLSARFGKSPALAALVTLLCVVGATPYIALQLQSVTLSVRAFAQGPVAADPVWLGLSVAGGLALFTILFGTRRLDAGERHDGIVSAIAVEAVVKLIALLSVGAFVVWHLNDGIRATWDVVAASPLSDWQAASGRWAGLIFVSAAAVICLPRMFHITVVENSDPAHLFTASWAFPAYLMAMCLFVVPIAATGLARLPDGNPDLFVLTLPLAAGQGDLAMLAFLGGFSSATSMVIVTAVALATMLSNHVVMPLWLARRGMAGATMSGDMRAVALRARRAAIVLVVAMGWAYYRVTGGTAALAAIGLVSFVGLAQILPALLAGLFWRDATRAGAAVGIGAGFLVWLWTMLLPVFDGPVLSGLMADGPFGLAWLRPQAMFGLQGDPLVTALVLSLGANVVLLAVVSLLTEPTDLERLQAARFDHATGDAARPAARGGLAGAEDLMLMAQRILGYREARALFAGQARAQGRDGDTPLPTADLMDAVERRLAGSVGAATAHAMVADISGRRPVSVEDLMNAADETAEALEQSARLQAQSRELERTAAELRQANAKLTRISAQKDAFLSQVSHELRTPMTSIRAFAEILAVEDLPPPERARYAAIVGEESRRLTRLLDDLLDLGVLESGQVVLSLQDVTLADVLDRAVLAAAPDGPGALAIDRDPAGEAVRVTTDPDRLLQVFINLIANAAKYCDAEAPRLTIRAEPGGAVVAVDFVDNGSGIAPEDRALAFEKFARLTDDAHAGGAGLGLAICREVMDRLGGSIAYLPGRDGGAFRVRIPRAAGRAIAAQ